MVSDNEEVFIGYLCVDRSQTDSVSNESNEPEHYISYIELRLYCHDEQDDEIELGKATLIQVNVGNAEEDGYHMSYPFESTQSLSDLCELISGDDSSVFSWTTEDITTEMYPHSLLILDDLRVLKEFIDSPILELTHKWLREQFESAAPLVITSIDELIGPPSGYTLLSDAETIRKLRRAGYRQIKDSTYFWLDLAKYTLLPENVVLLQR